MLLYMCYTQNKKKLCQNKKNATKRKNVTKIKNVKKTFSKTLINTVLYDCVMSILCRL